MKVYQAAVIIILIGLIPYAANLYKFSQCDFESNYRCEILHGIGVVVPPLSFIMVWFNTDNSAKY